MIACRIKIRIIFNQLYLDVINYVKHITLDLFTSRSGHDFEFVATCQHTIDW